MGVSLTETAKAKAVLEGNSKSGGMTQAEFRLWPCHAEPLKAFLASSTQWRMAAMGMAPSLYQGLDYTACKVVMEGEGIHLDKNGWTDFRILECEAADALNARAQA